jgi:hypothetical protein
MVATFRLIGCPSAQKQIESRRLPVIAYSMMEAVQDIRSSHTAVGIVTAEACDSAGSEGVKGCLSASLEVAAAVPQIPVVAVAVQDLLHGAISGCEHLQEKQLLDQLVGASKHRWRNGDAKLLRDLTVDDELELPRNFRWKLSWGNTP